MKRSTVEVIRGDTPIFDIPITDNIGNSFDLSGYEVYFTAKKHGNKIAKNSPDNGILITDEANGHAVMTLSEEDTQTVGIYSFDIQIKNGNAVHTVAMGDLIIIDDVTK